MEKHLLAQVILIKDGTALIRYIDEATTTLISLRDLPKGIKEGDKVYFVIETKIKRIDLVR
jgi:hypothetical protein